MGIAFILFPAVLVLLAIAIFVLGGIKELIRINSMIWHWKIDPGDRGLHAEQDSRKIT